MRADKLCIKVDLCGFSVRAIVLTTGCFRLSLPLSSSLLFLARRLYLSRLLALLTVVPTMKHNDNYSFSTISGRKKSDLQRARDLLLFSEHDPRYLTKVFPIAFTY